MLKQILVLSTALAFAAAVPASAHAAVTAVKPSVVAGKSQATFVADKKTDKAATTRRVLEEVTSLVSRL